MQPIEHWGAHRPTPVTSIMIGALRHCARGALKRPLRSALRPRVNVVDTTFDGIRLRCHVGDNFTENAIVEGRATQERANIERIIGDLLPGDTFLDVGANCGLYSLFAARKVGPGGHVAAIEPIPEMARRIAFNASVNGFAVSIWQNAVGDADGRMILNVNDRQYGTSSVASFAGAHPIEVEVKTLLGIVRSERLSRIDAMKIDIEGHEDRALMPFLRLATRELWPRRLLMEHRHAHRWQSDVIAHMTGHGYRIAWQDRYDTLLRL